MKDVNKKIIFISRFLRIKINLNRKFIFNDFKLINLLKF